MYTGALGEHVMVYLFTPWAGTFLTTFYISFLLFLGMVTLERFSELVLCVKNTFHTTHAHGIPDPLPSGCSITILEDSREVGAVA